MTDAVRSTRFFNINDVTIDGANSSYFFFFGYYFWYGTSRERRTS